MRSGRDIERVAQAAVSERLAIQSNNAGNLTLRRLRPVSPMHVTSCKGSARRL
jgi:hypothetical protein